MEGYDFMAFRPCEWEEELLGMEAQMKRIADECKIPPLPQASRLPSTLVRS